MDIAEIKAKHLEKLAQKCLVCFNKIDSILVSAYSQIMKHEQIEISRDWFSYNEFTNPVYHNDIIQEIISYYSKNWNVVYEHRKKEGCFTFSYKGDLSTNIQESKQETEVKEVETEEFKTEEFKTDRYSILDI